jgi:hypothetical protein
VLELFRALRAAANLDLARPHSFRDLPNKLDREQPIDEISARHFDAIRQVEPALEGRAGNTIVKI